MRKIVLNTLLAALLAATATSVVACQKDDPNALETHVKKLDDAEKRAEAFRELERIVSAIAADPEDERRKEFAEKVVPKLAEIWALDDVAPYREQILTMALQMKRPEAVSIWSQALMLDGSAEAHKQAIMALQGIRESNAAEADEAIIESLKVIMAKPSLDMADEQEGKIRYEMAKTLGELKAKSGVDPLVELLEQPEETQPLGVYKAAVDALGQIGDPQAVDALISVQFAVKDAATTSSIGERAISALGAIGEPAVPKLIETMEGKNETVNKLAAENGVEVWTVQATAVRALGVIGSSTAENQVIAYMPQRDCGEEEEAEDLEEDPEADLGMMALLRQIAANSLGLMRSEAAVDALCSCRDATHNPGDTWEIVTALGRIGNEPAYQCLKTIVSEGYYNPEDMGSSDLKYTLRWEGARMLILAAPHDKAAEVRETIEKNDPKVKAKVEELGYLKGVGVLEECKADKACYEKVLADSTRAWFEREVAAFNYGRMAEPGDLDAALKMAQAFRTRDPDARVNIAWWTGVIAGDKPCPKCAAALESVMEAEELSKGKEMQAAWLTARQTVAKVAGGASASSSE